MAVIITNMDMPGRCDECSLVTSSECPLIGIDVDEEMGSRDMNCPLKSADDLLNEIANYKLSSDEKEDMDEDSIKWGMKIAYDILNNYLNPNETEVWHGFHGDIIAPKGTFDRIYNECDTDDDGI